MKNYIYALIVIAIVIFAVIGMASTCMLLAAGSMLYFTIKALRNVRER